MSLQFPNVPIGIVGVPAVKRNATSRQDAYETLQRADSETFTAAARATWGVFSERGDPVILADSVTSFEYAAEYRIADFPLERGQFETFNKVQTPFMVRVVLTKGGTLSERQAFLTAVQLLQSSLQLYSVVTPERTYLDVNVERVAMVRSAETGAGLVSVEIGLREVRQNATVFYTRTTTETSVPVPVPAGRPETVKTPSAARPKAQGAIQPKKLPVKPAAPGGGTSTGVVIKQAGNVAKLVRTPSGRLLYVYDKPIGR